MEFLKAFWKEGFEDEELVERVKQFRTSRIYNLKLVKKRKALYCILSIAAVTKVDVLEIMYLQVDNDIPKIKAKRRTHRKTI